MGEKTYTSWRSMIQRCTNPNNEQYVNYGERGIKVCERWLKFENFLEDMGKRPPGCTIDRIDNDQGYSQKNCQWATSEQQQRNRRDNLYLTYNKKTQLLTEWAEEYKISHGTLWTRVYRLGWSTEKALTT